MKALILYMTIFLSVFFISCSKNDCEAREINNCYVTYDFSPVCGCNGVTYDNPSVANCNSITEYTSGACN